MRVILKEKENVNRKVHRRSKVNLVIRQRGIIHNRMCEMRLFSKEKEMISGKSD